MDDNLTLDNLDRDIITFLLRDSRKPFSDIAKKCQVSAGTVHLRIEKMKQAKIIIGSKINLDYAKLGYGVCAFIGIDLSHASVYQSVLENLKLFDEILEVYYTTGKHNLFIKVRTPDIQALHLFLMEKLQLVKGVHATETLISLDNPINRDVVPR